MTEEEETAAGGAEGSRREGGARLPFGRFWIVVSCVLLAASAVLLWRGLMEATFVVATLGVLAWFLNVRANLPPRGEDSED